MAVNMELETKGVYVNEDEEYRVQLNSKKVVVEQIKRYKEVLKKVLDDQPGIAEEAKQLLLQELLTNFEATVQENVLINGAAWEDAPDDEEEDEASVLDTCLDDQIVETTRKRRRYPKEILPHAVRSLKAQRKLLGMHAEVVKPQKLQKDPAQESLMTSLSAEAPGMFQKASAVMKSIVTLQQRADGLKRVLNLRPSPASLVIHSEVFGSRTAQSDVLPAPPGGAIGSRHPIKCSVEEKEDRNCYISSNETAAACGDAEKRDTH
ncbi:kinetochore-associated protein NSL1 homolog [Aplochiton taeniatus]